MRAFQHAMPATVSTLVLLLTQSQLVSTSPLLMENNDIEKRCSNPCGFYAQLCCTSSQTCVTNGGQAVCSDNGGSGSSGSGSGSDGDWDYFTSTYVMTETDTTTHTTTWSSQRAKATPTGGVGAGSGSGSCDPSVGETKCGSTCCGPASVCENGQCLASSSSIWATMTSAPSAEGTSNSAATATETGSATTTQPFETPIHTDGSPAIGVAAPDDKGLSGGAIAGIVIGTIAGVALLLLICACMCCRGALEALGACLGIGRRKRNDGYDDRYSHYNSGRPDGRTWFGARPPAPSHGGGSSGEKKHKWGGLATIGIVLGALALCLGLKRRRDHQDEKSDYTYPSSYYYSDYYTNSSMLLSSVMLLSPRS